MIETTINETPHQKQIKLVLLSNKSILNETPDETPPELFEWHSRVHHCVPSEQCVAGLRTRWSTRSESEGEAYSLLHVDVQHVEQSEEMLGG